MNKESTYYKKLQRRLSLILISVSLIPLFGISWSASNFYRQSYLASTAAGLQRTVENRKQVIAMFLEDQKAVISHFARLYSFEELTNQARLDAIFMVVAESGIVDMGVIDAAGRHAAYVGPYRHKLRDKNYSDTEWFQEVMIKGSHISDIFLGYREVPHIVVAVTDPLKKWVLRATINSEVLNGLLRSAQIGEKGDAFLINYNGELQTPRRFGGSALSEDERSLLAFHEGTRVQEINRNLYATGWLKEGDWLLFVKMDAASFLDIFYEARNRDTLIIALAAMVIIIAAKIIVEQLVNRIETADRKKSEFDSQMMQVEKMASLGRLAAGVAHEVNNPLQLIMDQAGWMRELLDEENPEGVVHMQEYRRSVEKITHHVKRASAVTHRLLGFSRKMETERSSVEVNTTVEEALSFLEREANNNDIIIHRHYREGLPAIMTDGPKVQQVILNLVNNSIDAIGKKGEIHISTGMEEDQITIQIEDTGPGINPEIIGRIFDPFFTTKAPGKGTGLGLSISYNLIQQLGGDIYIRNRENGGASFIIRIPIINPEMRQIREYRSSAENPARFNREPGAAAPEPPGSFSKGRAERTTVDVNAMVEEAVSLLENKASNHDIIIRRRFRDFLPPLLIDGARARQAVLALINCRIGAIGKNGRIDICTELADNGIAVRIEDTGSGAGHYSSPPGNSVAGRSSDGISACCSMIKTIGGGVEIMDGGEGGAVFVIIFPLTRGTDGGGPA